MTEEEQKVIVEVLCSQALADHLGDVRDAETQLWGLLGVPYREICRDEDEPYGNTKATLKAHGISLPEWLSDD